MMVVFIIGDGFEIRLLCGQGRKGSLSGSKPKILSERLKVIGILGQRRVSI